MSALASLNDYGSDSDDDNEAMGEAAPDNEATAHLRPVVMSAPLHSAPAVVARDTRMSPRAEILPDAHVGVALTLLLILLLMLLLFIPPPGVRV